ncbi:DUF4405 domain-containing protein [Candidatus Woesearchaeota archaeon]|nr:DUF4405 domain-containing protein [Candidatus Woesearchaeota archaeon]
MADAKRNYWIDFLMFLSIAVTALSGIILYIILPSGRRAGWQEFWGISREAWRNTHTWAGFVFIAIALIHLILHWKWIWAMSKGILKITNKNK